ncbi:MAG: potassium channel family protein [Sphingomicrobium sp.]
MAVNLNTRRPVRESQVWQAYNESRYAILFYALLLTLFVIPAVTTIGLPAFVLKLLLAASLFAAVMPNATPNSRYLLLAAAIALVIASLATEYGYLPVNSGLALALGGLVGLLAAAGALRFTVKSRVVNSETVYAALSTYLLAGLFFGQIYWAIENMRPGSLTGPDPVTEVVTIYYSFVTLATLGYGDYLPRTDIARGIATFEVIGGQLFLAVMVARLIGAFGGAEDDS